MTPEPYALTFGELLRRRRVATELTQEELAEKAGISVRTVSDLERGLNLRPRKDTLQLVVRALQLGPEERAELEALAHRERRPRPPAGHLEEREPAEACSSATAAVAPVASSMPEEARARHGAGKERQTAQGGDVSGLRMTLLGGFRVQVGSRVVPEETWRLRRAASLVKLLALTPQHRLGRERIMDLLWPDIEPRAAANSLHQVLHTARCLLDPHARLASRFLHLRGDVLSLSIEHPVWVDVEAFETVAEQARRGRDPATYRAALELYTGDLLPDDLYEDWVSDRRERLRQERLLLLLGLAQLYEDREEYPAAIDTLRAALDVDTAHEEAHAALMRLYALNGQRQQALRQYQALEAALRRELDVDPHPDTRRLYRDIAAGRLLAARPVAVQSGDTADTIGSVDGGTAVRHVSRAGTVSSRTNLPVQVNSFVGRAREQAEVKRLLVTTHLLTLIGVGGSGKTRLALQVAAGLETTFPDGVWLVELAALSQAGLVAHEVAAVLQVTERAGQPLTQTLADYLRPKQLLLLLDNCEHLIAASAALAEALVRTCPDLRILATSREPLHIPGETTWQVRSLSLPDPEELPPLDDLLAYEAVQLFQDRAHALVPAFAITPDNAPAVAQICYRLDGLPLAIELAAARVAALSVAQIAARLDDCFRLLTSGNRTTLSRQQTLKAALDWSHDLLAEQERVLFRRLAVFAGGFDLEAAEAIGAADGIEMGDVLDLLTRLVDKSLVLVEDQVTVMRYRLLEPVRQYARQALEASGEMSGALGRHRDWSLQVAELADAALWSAEHDACLARLELEHDNLRAALGWCVQSPDQAEAGLRLARALWQFWLWRGYLTEARRWLDRLLASAPAGTALQAEARLQACALAGRQGALSAATQMADHSLAIYESLGDVQGQAQALYLRGIVACWRFEYAEAQALFADGLERANRSDLAVERALFTQARGIVAWALGDYRGARALLEESIAILRAAGDRPRIATVMLLYAWTRREDDFYQGTCLTWENLFALLQAMSTAAVTGYVLANLGKLARVERRYGQAGRLLEESLARFRALGDRAGMGQALSQLGLLARATGDYVRALELFEESLALCRQVGDRIGCGFTLVHLGQLAVAQGDYQRASGLYDEAQQVFQVIAFGPGLAWLAGEMGQLALCEGAYDSAGMRFAEAFRLLRGIGITKPELSLYPAAEGVVTWLRGDTETARSLFMATLAICEEVGDRRSSAALLQHLAWMDLDAANVGLAQLSLRRSLILYQELGDARGVATALAGLATTQGDLERAVRLVAAALRDRGTAPANVVQSPTLERLLTRVRLTLGEEHYAAAWAEGQALSSEQVLAEARLDAREAGRHK